METEKSPNSTVCGWTGGSSNATNLCYILIFGIIHGRILKHPVTLMFNSFVRRWLNCMMSEVFFSDLLSMLYTALLFLLNRKIFELQGWHFFVYSVYKSFRKWLLHILCTTHKDIYDICLYCMWSTKWMHIYAHSQCIYSVENIKPAVCITILIQKIFTTIRRQQQPLGNFLQQRICVVCTHKRCNKGKCIFFLSIGSTWKIKAFLFDFLEAVE